MRVLHARLHRRGGGVSRPLAGNQSNGDTVARGNRRGAFGHLCRCGAYDGIFRAVAEACAGRFDGDDFVSPRVEAREKVTGLAKFTVDIRHDGQLEGVILRSHLAHAKIVELDLAPARAIPGVIAAISLLGDDRIVRYVGDPIAAVAATDRKTAIAAIAAIRIVSERLPSVIGLDAARQPDAPVVFEKSGRKKPATSRKARARRRPGRATSADRPRLSRTRQRRPEAGSRPRARRKIRGWSRAHSGPARNSTPAWSRMQPSPVSTATA